MILKLVCIVVYFSSVTCRNVPRYAELDEDEQLLFRAAYDSPSYSHEEYQEHEDLPVGKLDLLKDGMWAIKAKMLEMKAFNKALAANLLSTKLQVKEMLANHLKTLKNHHHVEIDKKPVYNYQTPPPQPSSYPQYEPPHYTAPVPQYGPPQYTPPHYGPPQFGPHQYEPPQNGAPQYNHDPYYGH